MKKKFDQKMAIEIGYFRFALIAPVIQNTFEEPTKIAYYRRVTESNLMLPNGKNIVYNPKTLAKWESAYRKQGMNGLMPKERKDSGESRVLDEQAIAEIHRLKEKFPRITATLIYEKMIEDGIINQSGASVSSVQRYIKRNHLKLAKDPNQKDRKAFEEEFPCGMFQADTSYTCFITENGKKRRTYLIHIVDDHSRTIVGARFFYNDNAYNFQKVLKGSVARYGICKKLYVDNGSPYANAQLKLICGSLGIILLHAPVHDGAAKGKVERSFRTLKESFLYGFDPSEVSSLEELNQLLAEKVRERNTAVNRMTGETPNVRYQRGIDRVKIPESREWLDECFMNRVTRKVNTDSTISIDKIYYDVPMEFIRSKVEIRYLPEQMESAYILHDGVKYPIRQTNRVENGRTKRKNEYSIDYSKMEDLEDV